RRRGRAPRRSATEARLVARRRRRGGRRVEVVGEVAGRVARARRGGIVEHSRVPLLPLGPQGCEALRQAVFQVSALKRIGDHVEQELVLVDLEVLVVAAAGGSLL